MVAIIFLNSIFWKRNKATTRVLTKLFTNNTKTKLDYGY